MLYQQRGRGDDEDYCHDYRQDNGPTTTIHPVKRHHFYWASAFNLQFCTPSQLSILLL